jgi:hypothetical protein
MSGEFISFLTKKMVLGREKEKVEKTSASKWFS